MKAIQKSFSREVNVLAFRVIHSAIVDRKNGSLIVEIDVADKDHIEGSTEYVSAKVVIPYDANAMSSEVQPEALRRLQAIADGEIGLSGPR